jgi:hypothetical protein
VSQPDEPGTAQDTEVRKDPAVEAVSVSAGVPFGLPNVMRLAPAGRRRAGDRTVHRLRGRAIVRAYLEVEMPIVDPWMIVIVIVIVPVPLILAAFCACYLPARRAGGVEPNVALRHL